MAQVQSVSFRSPGRSHPYLYTIVEALSCQSEWLSATHRAERARASIACGTLVNTRSSRRDTLGLRATAGQDPSHRKFAMNTMQGHPLQEQPLLFQTLPLEVLPARRRRVGGSWRAGLTTCPWSNTQNPNWKRRSQAHASRTGDRRDTRWLRERSGRKKGDAG